MKLRILVAGLMLGMAATAAETGEELFQKALTAERAAGNLEEAIKLYQRVAKEFASDRALAAKALVQEARCYEKLGKDNAVKIYEQVARDYRDQREPSAMATGRLAALRMAEHPAPATMTQRKLALHSQSSYFASSDGEREVYIDDATGALTIADLAGRDKRTIFKPKAGDRIGYYYPSRDLSMVLIALTGSDNSYRYSVIKADGTGYREIGEKSTCEPNWSWDSRYLAICRDDPDGTRQLLWVSSGNGEIRKTRADINYHTRLSPDGRFMAFDTVAAMEPTSFGKILLLPIGGGGAQVVFDGAKLIDWTRDGRYLILESARSGSEALYLLPIKDGRAAGDPVFVRYGPCYRGSSTLSGGLTCMSALPGGLIERWMSTLDSSGHVAEWKRLSLGFSPDLGTGIHWSPDGTRVVYVSLDESAGKDKYGVRLRDIASGEEREVFRSARRPACTWAAHRPNLLCVPFDSLPGKEVTSVSIDSGRVERLGQLPGADYFWPFFSSADDRSIYFGTDPRDEMVRWDSGTQQITFVEKINGWGLPGMVIPEPNEHWIGRRIKDTTEIRPFAGGEWRPLLSMKPTHISFTPDGNWLLYHDVDPTGKDALFRVPTAGGRAERIGPFPGAAKTNPPSMAVSPDGRKILAEFNTAPEVWLIESFEPKQQAAR